MQSIIKQLRASTFLRHNAILFAGAIGAGALNYLYYPILGRMLEPSAFGEVQTLVSLFLQIVIFLNVMGLLTVNIIANNGDNPEAQRTVFELEKLALIISFLILIATFALGPILKSFFNFDELLPFATLALAIVVSVPATFRTAFLRGKQLFAMTSIANIIGAAAKLALSVIFVLLGFGTTGAILGLVLAQVISAGYAAVRARQNGFGPSLREDIWKLPNMKLVAPELKYALLVLVGSLTITAFYSIDIIVVKHLFDAHTAGLYAGISTVARIIFFLTATVSQVLMPAIKIKASPKDNQRALKNSLVLLLGLGGGALLVFAIVPRLIVQLLMGKDYLEYASLLPWLSLVILIVSVLNLYVSYYMALRQYAIAVIAIMGLAVTCGLVGIHHDSLRAVVDSMLYGTCTMGILLAGWIGARKLKSKQLGGAET